VLTILMGCLGAFLPKKAAQLTCLEPLGATGVSEIRATYGGLFIGLGAVALFHQSVDTFLVVGLAWVGAACGRVWSVVIDRNIEAKNLGGVGFELAFGVPLLLPWMFSV
jgi:hypothetical protein